MRLCASKHFACGHCGFCQPIGHIKHIAGSNHEAYVSYVPMCFQINTLFPLCALAPMCFHLHPKPPPAPAPSPNTRQSAPSPYARTAPPIPRWLFRSRPALPRCLPAPGTAPLACSKIQPAHFLNPRSAHSTHKALLQVGFFQKEFEGLVELALRLIDIPQLRIRDGQAVFQPFVLRIRRIKRFSQVELVLSKRIRALGRIGPSLYRYPPAFHTRWPSRFSALRSAHSTHKALQTGRLLQKEFEGLVELALRFIDIPSLEYEMAKPFFSPSFCAFDA